MNEEIIVSERAARWRTYAIAFLITALIFATAFWASVYFNDRRIAEVRSAQDNISIDILSLETQFDLLAAHSCRDISENSVLSREIHPLGEQLSYLETQPSVNQEALRSLKRYYSLLQIKDLLLMQEVSEKCGLKPIFILYFYSNKGDCENCEGQGYTLTALSQMYPQLRVYSFDYNLDVSALQTLIQIRNVEGSLPALVIKDKAYYGLKTTADIEKIIPELATLKKAKFKEVVTTDPHTFNTFRNEYPEFGGNYTIHHYTGLLAKLIDDGKLKFTKKLNYKATYHDPCYLARYNRETNAPRQVMQAFGLELREMPRCRENTFCCGAGGGRIWMDTSNETNRTSEQRIKEALGVGEATPGGVQYFITACPKDYTMYTDAVKTSGNEGKIEVKDLIELIAEALNLLFKKYNKPTIA